MKALKTALIAGSSGLVGSQLLSDLLADQSIERVIILVRNPLDIRNNRLQQVVTDFERLDTIAEWFKGVDAVFCCLGTTIKKAKSKEAFKKVDYEFPLALATLSEQNNVNHFLCITAMGADVASGIFYNKVKGEVERDISKKKIPCITFFRPSLLIGNRKESRPGERIGIFIARILGFLFIGPLKNYKGIRIEKVAKAMHAEAQDPQPGLRIVLSGSMQ